MKLFVKYFRMALRAVFGEFALAFVSFVAGMTPGWRFILIPIAAMLGIIGAILMFWNEADLERIEGRNDRS